MELRNQLKAFYVFVLAYLSLLLYIIFFDLIPSYAVSSTGFVQRILVLSILNIIFVVAVYKTTKILHEEIAGSSNGAKR